MTKSSRSQDFECMKMEVELKENVAAEFVPTHLLKAAKGNEQLQSYFRYIVIHNYRRGISNYGLGTCAACFKELTVHDQPRIRSSQKKTKKLQKLLAKSKEGAKLSKFEANAVKRFWTSSSQLTVKCPQCGYINNQAVMTNEQKYRIKESLHQDVEKLSEIRKGGPEDVKKKKKKKKKRASGKDEDTLTFHSVAPQSTTSQSKVSEIKHYKSPQPSPQVKLQAKGKIALKKKKDLQSFLSTMGKAAPKSSLKDFLSSL